MLEMPIHAVHTQPRVGKRIGNMGEKWRAVHLRNRRVGEIQLAWNSRVYAYVLLYKNIPAGDGSLRSVW